jgi:mannose/fructose-specific phosphotransferase system component IIA
MPRTAALLVMHSDLADALMRAAEKVYGAVDGVDVLSNEGLSREDLEQAISRRVADWGEGGGLVLTDFWGGSCHICGVAAARGHGDVVVVTGINLPLLLDYLHNRDEYGPMALAERLIRKGRDSIRLHHGQTA